MKDELTECYSFILHPSFKNCRGSNYGCPREVLPGKGRRTGSSPAPTIYSGNESDAGKLFENDLGSNRFYAQTFVEVVIEIIEIEHRPIQDQRQLRNVGRVDDKVEIT